MQGQLQEIQGNGHGNTGSRESRPITFPNDSDDNSPKVSAREILSLFSPKPRQTRNARQRSKKAMTGKNLFGNQGNFSGSSQSKDFTSDEKDNSTSGCSQNNRPG